MHPLFPVYFNFLGYLIQLKLTSRFVVFFLYQVITFFLRKQYYFILKKPHCHRLYIHEALTGQKMFDSYEWTRTTLAYVRVTYFVVVHDNNHREDRVSCWEYVTFFLASTRYMQTRQQTFLVYTKSNNHLRWLVLCHS